MDKVEAREILEKELLRFRRMSYADLYEQIKSENVVQRMGASGVLYTIEIEVFLDDPREKEGPLRVLASIDDGGFFAAFSPLSSNFIIDREGKFTGE
jgi:hypothetical protein